MTVYRDRIGVPHIRAASHAGLAFMQGHNVAMDRAWQIEIERHRAEGTTAALLGADGIGWDRFARQARIADTAQRCFEALSEETRTWLKLYVEGVNSGLVEGVQRAEAQFAHVPGQRVGEWQPWTPLAIWLSTHILFAAFPTKLWREEVAQRLGDAALELFAIEGPSLSGSNGWMVDASRSATGHAILAGDPHRFLEDPGVYQQVRLECPSYDVVGFAIPGVPGVAHFGHAGNVAWAITNAMADYQDLYREELRRSADGARIEARGPEGWEPVEHHRETIAVAGGEAIEIDVLETARGPIIVGGVDQAFTLSLRHPPRVRRELGFDAMAALLHAKNVGDVDRALDGWVEPVNVVQAADTDGGLLHRVAGKVPVRDDANRLRIVPAWDSKHAWRGWHDMPRADIPDREPNGERNGVKGFAPIDGISVMANQRGISSALGVEFSPPYRANRIAQLLRAKKTWAPADMAAIHMDIQLDAAAPLLAIVERLDDLSPAATRLRDQLLTWDRRMAANSVDAGAFASVRSAIVLRIAADPRLAELAAVVRDPRYPELLTPWLALKPRIAFALERLLEAQPHLPLDARAIVRGALEDVAAGSAPAAWGERHLLAPWRALPDDEAPGPGLAGDHDCVLSTFSLPGITDLCARGPAARFVWDLAQRDHSAWIVPFGASGVAGDPHARDQLASWRSGELSPVVTDWNALTREVPKRSLAPLFERTYPGFGLLQVIPLLPFEDLDRIYAWVKEERAHFWGMTEYTRAEVLEVYEYLDLVSTRQPYWMCRNGEPAVLFQSYDPRVEIGDFYEGRDGDMGGHLLAGPPLEKEHNFTAVMIGAMIDFGFDYMGVKRIVGEPDARNTLALKRFAKSGFENGALVQLPHKPAQLMYMTPETRPPSLSGLPHGTR